MKLVVHGGWCIDDNSNSSTHILSEKVKEKLFVWIIFMKSLYNRHELKIHQVSWSCI